MRLMVLDGVLLTFTPFQRAGYSKPLPLMDLPSRSCIGLSWPGGDECLHLVSGGHLCDVCHVRA